MNCDDSPWSWLTAAMLPVGNPYSSCKLTHLRRLAMVHPVVVGVELVEDLAWQRHHHAEATGEVIRAIMLEDSLYLMHGL